MTATPTSVASRTVARHRARATGKSGAHKKKTPTPKPKALHAARCAPRPATYTANLAHLLVMMVEYLVKDGFTDRGGRGGWQKVPPSLYVSLPPKRRRHRDFFLEVRGEVYVDVSELMAAAYELAPEATTTAYWTACMVYSWARNQVGVVNITFPFQREYDAVAAAAPREHAYEQ